MCVCASQDGPFCVFPRDYCVDEGENVVINVEYLPSEIGLHEARFIMVQASVKKHGVPRDSDNSYMVTGVMGCIVLNESPNSHWY